jgi:hypothetical protein
MVFRPSPLRPPRGRLPHTARSRSRPCSPEIVTGLSQVPRFTQPLRETQGDDSRSSAELQSHCGTPENASILTGGRVVQTDMVACRLRFARRPSQSPNDDSADDNRDDSGLLNYVPYSPKMHVSRLVTAPA